MTPERRALELIALVYDAVTDSQRWHAFAKALSDHFAGAAVVVEIHVLGEPATTCLCGITPEVQRIVRRHLADGMSTIAIAADEVSEHFVRMSDYVPDGFAPFEAFAREVLEPNDLACEPPIVHMTNPEAALFSTDVIVYRQRGAAPIDDDALDAADLVIPHLRRALALRSEIGGSTQTQVALSEVIDRIPIGILLVDSRHRIVLTNRMADRILEMRDGLRVDGDAPRASDSASQRNLERLIDSAVAPAPGREIAGGGFAALPRPSGLRPYPVLVTPILGQSSDRTVADAAAALFISDPELRDISVAKVLMDLYGLTPAEAELAQGLAQGRSLEEAARARGVTLNTARSQLKQVFAKTNTNRQGELLQLVLRGVATVRQQDGGAASTPR